MSFIDLMGDIVWSTEDIAKRSQRIVLNQFTRQQIRDLDDMVTGTAQGMYELTPEEEALVQTYGQARLQARTARLEAESDNLLLSKAISYENSIRNGEEVSEVEQEVLDLVVLRARDLTPPQPSPEEEIVEDSPEENI